VSPAGRRPALVSQHEDGGDPNMDEGAPGWRLSADPDRRDGGAEGAV
jgi:hypothetical protein